MNYELEDTVHIPKEKPRNREREGFDFGGDQRNEGDTDGDEAALIAPLSTSVAAPVSLEAVLEIIPPIRERPAPAKGASYDPALSDPTANPQKAPTKVFLLDIVMSLNDVTSVGH